MAPALSPSPPTGSAQDIALATIPVGAKPWALAVNPATNRIYVANEFEATVSEIDGVTNTVVDTITVGYMPWAWTMWSGSTGVSQGLAIRPVPPPGGGMTIK